MNKAKNKKKGFWAELALFMGKESSYPLFSQWVVAVQYKTTSALDVGFSVNIGFRESAATSERERLENLELYRISDVI